MTGHKILRNLPELGSLHRVFKVKPMNLCVYKNAQYLYEHVLRKKVKKFIRSKKLAENRFRMQKNTIFSELIFIEKYLENFS